MPVRSARIAVVGGGITGLAAAHRLHELSAERSLDLQVSLLEAGPRLGGVISTVERDGFVLEEGPDSILSEKPWARQLAERIGIGDRIIGTQEQHRKSFVVRNRRLEPTPDGFYMLAPTRFMPMLTTRIFSPLGKLRMGLDLVLPRARGKSDESVASFVTRRLGREALERMAQPMIAGIYGADPEILSLRATFPRFLQMEQEYGSVIRAMLAAGRKRAAMMKNPPGAGAGKASGPRYGLFISFEGGLQILTDAIAARLPAGSVQTGQSVQELAPSPSGGWSLATPAGRQAYDAVILAMQANSTAPLVRGFDPKLADKLASIRYGTAATVSLAWKEADIEHPLDGFGFVVPTVEKMSIVGCTFGHRKYAGRAPGGHALLRAFWGDASLQLSEEEIRQRTLDDLRPLLGVRAEPIFSHVSRWPATMPHYAVGHLDLVDEIEKAAAGHPGLALAGNAYRGIGVPDCVHSGEDAAEAITERIAAAQPA